MSAKKAREAVQPGYTAVPPAACGDTARKGRHQSFARERGAAVRPARGAEVPRPGVGRTKAQRRRVPGARAASASQPWSAAGSRSWPRTISPVPSGCLPGPSSARVPAIAKASRAGSHPPISSSARRCTSSATRPEAQASRPGTAAGSSRTLSVPNARCSCSTAWSRCSPPIQRSSAARSRIPASPRLVEELARHNSGLCIVTTREPIAEPDGSAARGSGRSRRAELRNPAGRSSACCGSGGSRARTTSWSTPSKPSAATPTPCSCSGVTWSSSAVRRSLLPATIPAGAEFAGEVASSAAGHGCVCGEVRRGQRRGRALAPAGSVRPSGGRRRRSTRCGRHANPGSDGASRRPRRRRLARLLDRLRATRAGRAGEQPRAGRGGRASAGAGAFRGGAAGEASRGLAGGARAAVRALQGAAGEGPARHAGGDGAAVPGGVPRLPGGPASRGAESRSTGRGSYRERRSLRQPRSSARSAPIWRRWLASSIRRGRGL